MQSELNATHEESESLFADLKSELNSTIGQLKNDINQLSYQFSNLELVTNNIISQNMQETQSNVQEQGSGLPCHFNSSKSQNQYVSIARVEEIQQSLQNQINALQISTICGPGLWQRVAFLNMSDPSQQCPSDWEEYSANGVRACGRSRSLRYNSCSSKRYSSSNHFRRVCGRIIGYQVGSTDVFHLQNSEIDTAYVDGVSITTGGAHAKHIWTYVAGLSDQVIPGLQTSSCPCLLEGTSYTPQVPPTFVGNNYYCESGNPTNNYQHSGTLTYTNDPLWDGQQCEGQCCSNGKSPPWFSVELPNPTTENIDVRICGTDLPAREDTPINILEIYVQ